MVKQFGGVYLIFFRIAQRTDDIMKNEHVFHLNSGSSKYYCVKGILHTNILNTN